MLVTLQRIVQHANAAADLDEALAIIVREVKVAMAVDVCSVYAKDPATGVHVLIASDGLNPASVGKVRMKRGEGIIGLVSAREELINLENAAEHPNYRYFPETGEDRYQGFLGVPLVHFRQLLGVLVVRQRERRLFDKTEEAFLFTVGAQLAGALSHAAGGGSLLDVGRGTPHLGKEMRGSPAAPGIAIGTIALPSPLANLEAVADRRPQDLALEEAAFRTAVSEVQAELRRSTEQSANHLPSEGRALFDVYALMLNDESLVTNTITRIHAGNWAPAALRDTIAELTRSLEQADAPYMRARAEDIRALGRRLLLCLRGEPTAIREYPAQTVLVGEEVSLLRIAQVPAGRLAGVVCLRSSGLSHTAVVAKGLGIPAVVALGHHAIEHLDGHAIVVDGYQGRVFIDPPQSILREYERIVGEQASISAKLRDLQHLPAETPDGIGVQVQVNVGLLSEVTVAKGSGAEGVGLYRTEFSFMIRDTFPVEEEQVGIYRQILESFAPQSVVMRTLDVGGDKPLPYFPMEETNPYLGLRGIRFTLSHPEIFVTQLRAMLRANAGLNNLKILLPMVSQVAEVKDTRDLIARVQHELKEEAQPFAPAPLGAMIEIPSAVYNVRALARYVDFFSVGTNDLTQYLLAVDRNDPHVSSLYADLDPSVIRALRSVVNAARRLDRPVSVCGEMAGDPAGVILLLGMGIDTLSMTAACVPRIKWVIRTVTAQRAKTILRRALTLDSAAAIHQLLHTELERAGLGELVSSATLGRTGPDARSDNARAK
jgi:phosphotransferase system enzyme I (PtsP)